MIAVFLFTLCLGLYVARNEVATTKASRIIIDGTATVVEVARTGEEQQKGLSGRPSLPEGKGMLFIFSHPDRYGFWMPDMHFAIDIIWIGPDWHIVDISPDVIPESYPNVFTPSIPARYVLEVPAGTASRYGWKTGDSVAFDGIP